MADWRTRILCRIAAGLVGFAEAVTTMALCCCWCCAGVGVLGVRSHVRVMSHDPPLVSHQSSVVSHQSRAARNIGYKLGQIGFDHDCKFNRTAIVGNLAAVREWVKSIEQGAGKCSIITLTAIDLDPSFITSGEYKAKQQPNPSLIEDREPQPKGMRLGREI